MIGVLALQGAFQKHQDCLHKLNVPSKQIRHPEELEECAGLIIPGGETTTHLKLLKEKFWEALLEFGAIKPIFGTCCGLILLSKEVVDSPLPTLGLMNIKASRNAYGSQVESFEDEIEAEFDEEKIKIKGCFIRAPKIIEVSSSVSILATHNESPVIVEEGLHLACSFHPEVSMDLSLHKYFARRCQRKNEAHLIPSV